MRQPRKGFLFFKIFNKSSSTMNKITQHFTGASPPSPVCTYDTLDNATTTYAAIHEWQEGKKYDDPHKNVPMLDNNGQRVLHPHPKLLLSFPW